MKILILILAISSVNFVLGDYENLYDGCGDKKVCLGPTDDCVGDKDCVTFGSAHVENGKLVYEMKSFKQAKYIAIGLSKDKWMGEDSVIECVKNNDKVDIFSSMTNTEGGEYGAPRDGVPQNIMKLVEGKIVNGEIYCKVERDLVTKVKGIDFDVNKPNYYVMLVSGSSLRENSVDYHDFAYTVSKTKPNFF
ncbi:hypothetical protein PVAND_015391 [Polypedilum vanderplanki]|uniref:DOMON domain-containing protein n=1 Tax=Polypedilum vanderplanki TaxID=319348 RepID=A0A9J6BCH7_POLVA|nr:hypothetical protein PVAND_015391 [Polypedilum vanderplanki]